MQLGLGTPPKAQTRFHTFRRRLKGTGGDKKMEMEISSANASVNSPDKRVSFCRPRGCLLSSPSHAHSGLVEQRGDWVQKGTALHCRPGVCHCNPDRPNQWLAQPRQAAGRFDLIDARGVPWTPSSLWRRQDLAGCTKRPYVQRRKQLRH